MAVKDVGYSTLEQLVIYQGADYSPNNIRRIIISPEGVGVFYYVERHTIFRIFPLMSYAQASKQPDFKPMLKNLYTNRQLTSIEEIVILTTGSNGQVMLHPDEYSIQTIIGKRGATSFEGCKNSYKRLRYITVINNVCFSRFAQAIKGLKFDFISELDIFRSYAQINEIWGSNEYYKQNGISIKSRETYPAMDGAGGKLVKYFESVRVQKEKELKSSVIAEQKAEATKGLRADFDKIYKDYTFAVSCNGRLLSFINKYGFNALTTQDTILTVVKADIKKFSSMKVNEKIVNLIDCSNDKEALEFNIKSLREAIQRIYLLLAKDLYTRILNLGDYTAKIIMDNCECVVAPKGNELAILNQKIQNKAGKSFKGESVLDSIANACAYTCRYFISSYADNLDRFYEKQFWIGGR